VVTDYQKTLSTVFKRLTVVIVFEISLKKRLPDTKISKLNDNRLPVFKNFRLLLEPITNFIENGFKPWIYYQVIIELKTVFNHFYNIISYRLHLIIHLCMRSGLVGYLWSVYILLDNFLRVMIQRRNSMYYIYGI